MKIALLGRGKTGSHVEELAKKEDGIEVVVYDSKNPATVEQLGNADAVISFLPGDPFVEYIPKLLEANATVVSGSTGHQWPADLDDTLKEKGLTWIWASNFSLGMNLITMMLRILSKAPSLLRDPRFEISDIHHIKKLDSPSGTALRWKDWLGICAAGIISERKGDIVGIHELTMQTESETISVKHQAHNRGLFAEGAIWSAKRILEGPSLDLGLLKFEDIIIKELL